MTTLSQSDSSQTSHDGNEEDDQDRKLTTNALLDKAGLPDMIGDNNVINARDAGRFCIPDITADADAAAVRISITDRLNESVSAEGVLGTDGKWAFAETDLSKLTDGELELTARTLDAFGNESVAIRRLIKATATVAKAVLPEAITRDNSINAVESKALAVRDIRVDPETTGVQLMISDAIGGAIEAQAVRDAAGQWAATKMDVSVLADGELQIAVRARDAFGNESVAERTLTKSTAAPAKAAFPANIANHNIASKSLSIRGVTADPLATNVKISVMDNSGNTIETGAVKDFKGHWNVVGLDLSTLADGDLQLAATSFDAFGNESVATRTITKAATTTTKAARTTPNATNKAESTTTSLRESAARG